MTKLTSDDEAAFEASQREAISDSTADVKILFCHQNGPIKDDVNPGTRALKSSIQLGCS